ncbi:NAD(P)H-binding protein, partial [Rhizobium ruizarguesonis]
MFVITGVTGQVGGIVAARLLKAGVPIRAVARNAEKEEEWKDKGAELALAEMTDADALTKA